MESRPSSKSTRKKKPTWIILHTVLIQLRVLLNYGMKLVQLLSAGGFALRKWASSHSTVLQDFPSDWRETPLRFSDSDPVVKVLGLEWTAATDTFGYHIQPFTGPVTKRTIMSYIARIYDPNGYLAPVIFSAKNLIQQLWVIKVAWDDPLPENIAKFWENYTAEIPLLSNYKIPRSFNFPKHPTLRLIGFCDASNLGYSAVTYLQVEEGDKCRAILLQSKTRVAPLKLQTIPRLELLGAQLLTQVITKLRPLFTSLRGIHLFSDSQIVLAWISKSPSSLETFVAHRVQEIQNNTADCNWGYVHTKKNPSDLACRGLSPSQLLNNRVWLEGPEFLSERLTPVPDSKTIMVVNTCRKSPVSAFLPDLERASNYHRLLRTFAWIIRFVENCRTPMKNRYYGPLTSDELHSGLLLCVKITQSADLHNDLAAIKKGQLATARVRPLAPFIDPSGILRVGNRLRQSSLPNLHPILLPKESHLSKLICDSYHRLLLHTGPRTTQSFIQRKFWILGLSSLVRKQIHRCPTCVKLGGKTITPPMAPLPAVRTQNVRCFQNVSLDYAGPFLLKETKLRKAREYKAYILIIVCQSTKAIYCDIVSDLTTAAFLAAFTRFTSRRGCPSAVFSDLGTNFVGAARKFDGFIKFLRTHDTEIFTALSTLNIKWIFNVPLAPHMNGLAEAGVKASKTLLTKVIGCQKFTWEEFSTLLARVEAVLNSRPIGALSNDPSDDNDYLSPGHFLIGAPLMAPPEEHTDDSRIPPGQRWKLLTQVTNAFWTRWKSEYANTLVQQNKWFKATPDLKIDDLVFITDLNSSPLSWPLGRISAVQPVTP